MSTWSSVSKWGFVVTATVAIMLAVRQGVPATLFVIFASYVVLLYAYILVPWPHRRWPKGARGEKGDFRRLVVRTYFSLVALAILAPTTCLASYTFSRYLPSLSDDFITQAMEDVHNKEKLQDAMVHVGASSPQGSADKGSFVGIARREELRFVPTRLIIEVALYPVFDRTNGYAWSLLFLLIVALIAMRITELLGGKTYGF